MPWPSLTLVTKPVYPPPLIYRSLLIGFSHYFFLLLAASLTVLVMSNFFDEGCSCNADLPSLKDVRATREQLLCSLLHHFTALRGFHQAQRLFCLFKTLNA